MFLCALSNTARTQTRIAVDFRRQGFRHRRRSANSNTGKRKSSCVAWQLDEAAAAAISRQQQPKEQEQATAATAAASAAAAASASATAAAEANAILYRKPADDLFHLLGGTAATNPRLPTAPKEKWQLL